MKGKNINKIVIVIVIIIVLSIILGITNTISKEENDNIVENGEVSVEVQNELNSKVDYLTIISGSNSDKLSLNDFRNLSDNNLSNDLKLNIVLDSLNVSNANIDINKVNERYKSLFGEEISNYLTVGECPIYNYNETIKEYTVSDDCNKEESDIDMYTYKAKYAKEGASVSVYVSYALVEKIDASETHDNQDRYNIYSDLDKSVLYKGYITKSELDKFKIAEDNYEDLAIIKYTFIPDSDGTYNISKVEIAN